MSDDMPPLESAPLLFSSLTHLSEAAALVDLAGGGGKKKRGQKRSHATASAKLKSKKKQQEEDDEEDEEDEEGFSDFSDGDEDLDDDDDDSIGASPQPATSSAAAAAAGGVDFSSGGVALPSSPGYEYEQKATQIRAVRPKAEETIDGAGRAKFPEVQTVHATAFLGRPVDVKEIARRTLDVEYKPPSAIHFRIRNPTSKVIVYSTGNYVCLGGKSTVDMITIARKVARKIQKIGKLPDGDDYSTTIGFHNFSQNNISANAAFGYRINLRALSEDPAFADYTEYEPENWKGLHYKLPIDPTKTLADLLPSYAALIAARNKTGEQFSNDEFLQQGEHALIGQGKGKLSYYATTAGSRNKSAAAIAQSKFAPLAKTPPSLNGQILTATIYGNGRLTLTGVKREGDIHAAYLRLFRILQPFATTMPPAEPPSRPPYPRRFLPGQRRLIKREQQAQEVANFDYEKAEAYAARQIDVKPNIRTLNASTTATTAPSSSSSIFVLQPLVQGVKEQVIGTFAVKTEPNQGATVAADATHVKQEANDTAGASAASAIVIEGLPEPTHTTAVDEEVEWE